MRASCWGTSHFVSKEYRVIGQTIADYEITAKIRHQLVPRTQT